MTDLEQYARDVIETDQRARTAPDGRPATSTELVLAQGILKLISARTEARRSEPEVRLKDHGSLDEVVSDNAQLEQMDFNHWFLEIRQGKRAVAVWLHSGTKIKATFEWRDNEAPVSPPRESQP